MEYPILVRPTPIQAKTTPTNRNGAAAVFCKIFIGCPLT